MTDRSQPFVSVVVAAWNEEVALPRLLEHLARQSRRPDEVVVGDGGSIDSTIARAYETADRLGLPVTVVSVPGNISKGRNAAVAAARGEIIAVTDADCIPKDDWLERLIAPFATPGVSAVSGSYTMAITRAMQRPIAVFTWVEQRPDKAFLPSHRSVAYTKALWEQIGGYREDIDTGEDTLFDLEVVKCAGFAQAVEALVAWPPRETLRQAVQQQLYYGCGDGQAKIQWAYHAACFAFTCAEFGVFAGSRLVAAASVALVAAAAFWALRKHYRMFGARLRDWPIVLLLLAILPPARFAGFVLGVVGLSARALFKRPHVQADQ